MLQIVTITYNEKNVAQSKTSSCITIPMVFLNIYLTADEQETEIEVQNAYWDHAVKVQTIVQLWDSGEAIATSETLFVKTGKTCMYMQHVIFVCDNLFLHS